MKQPGHSTWRYGRTVLVLSIVIAASLAAGASAATINVPADYGTIQGAITAAAPNDTIVVAAGTYAERLTITKSLTLQGAQAGVDPTAAGARVTPAAESIITESGLSTPNPDVLIEIPSGVTNVIIDGFTLNGDQTNTTADTSVIRCWDDNITVRCNIIDGMTGVLYKGNDGLVVDRNRIVANKSGIVVQPSPATAIAITGNSISVGTAPQSDMSGIYITGADDILIGENTITGFSGRGMGGSGWDNATIRGNTLSGNRDGISIWGDSDFISIVDNTITGSTRYGISIKGADIDISGNSVTGSASSGILVDVNVGATERVTVRYNTLTGNGTYGLEVTSGVTGPVDAEMNWWGDSSGPSGEGSGTGDAVSTNADYTPWATEELPLGDVAYVVSPPMLATGKPEFSEPHGTGTNPFGYDWDSAAPLTAGGAPTGYGLSSFYASVSETGATEPDRYRTFRIGLRSLFGREVEVGELARISYSTKKPAPQTAIDWRISMYTTYDPSDPSGNKSSWYRNRIQNHPAACLNLNAPADTWNLWSTDTGTNQMLFGTNRTGFTAEDISFSELTGGPVTRGTYTWDFSGEEVMMIDLILGANTGGGTGESQMDRVVIELTNGQSADIDLTAGSAWKVATVHGHDQFTIDDDREELLYHVQPRNTHGWYWYENNGAAPGVLATGGLQVPDGYRDGSRTFATTDVAVGKKLCDLKLVFEYKHSLGGYVTVNFFMTDGAGKFGIFAPTSLGIGVVGGITPLDADWSRMTIDLTQTSIPDSTSVAVYEHNGFTDVYGVPYTTMTWGDIKNYTIAGMYDYQRSPANGWHVWGTMFDPINAAGVSTVVNGYGLALIWGDTVGNVTYTTQQRSIRNVSVTYDGVEYMGLFEDAQIHDVLELNATDASLYVKPGETVDVDLDVLNLQQEVKACQAILGYDSTYLTATTVVAGGGDWDDLTYELINTGDAEIDMAVGVLGNTTSGTSADGTVAKIALTAGSTEGLTRIVFRTDVSDVESTFLSDMNAQAVWPTKFNSQWIVIDGTLPDIEITSATQGGTELLIENGSTTNAVQGTVSITVTAADALAGLAAPPTVTVTPNGGSAEAATFVAESPAGTFNYTWTVTSTTPNGIATVDATVEDLAGNVATASSKTFNINKNQVTGTVSFSTLKAAAYSFDRDVVFVATDGGGAVLKTWTETVSFANAAQVASGNYTLTDVPGATVNLSAKTGWHLRKRQAVALDGDGQAVSDFTLLGGDLNATNSINILDYTILKTRWYGTDPLGDINGDGICELADYAIMKTNWFLAGDPQ